MLAVLEVHVVDKSGFNWTDVFGPLAIVIAALLGAFFAARYASQRLTAESNAEDRRLRIRLANDRLMREREARRNVVDDATQLITDTVELTSNNIADIMALQDRLLELEQAAGDDE